MLGLEVGTVLLERYQIIRPLGAGGMGAVYLASDSRHQNLHVAIKIIYPGLMKNEETRERFLTEISAVYSINHVNTVRAFEFFDGENVQALVMEYLDGGDLQQRMELGAIEDTEVLRILQNVASGLSAIHEAGITHRDLKPENIVLDKEGVVKITDFGVARILDTSSSTEGGSMVGTPKYIAPEYVETGECDHRADIYALGVIGYEMLTGQSPFRSESRASLILERVQERFQPICEVLPNCLEPLARVIEKAMSVPVADRYQSAEMLLADLERVASGVEPVHALKKAPSAVLVTEKKESKKVIENDKEDISRTQELKIESNVVWDKVGQAEPTIQVPTEKIVPDPLVFEEVAEDEEILGSSGAHDVEKQRGIVLDSLSRTGTFLKFLFYLIGILAGFASGVFLMQEQIESEKMVQKISPKDSLGSVPEGVYKGVVMNLTHTNSITEFKLWKSSKKVSVHLVKEGCGIETLGTKGAFSCGEDSYQMSVSFIENSISIGSVKNISMGRNGTFSLIPDIN